VKAFSNGKIDPIARLVRSDGMEGVPITDARKPRGLRAVYDWTMAKATTPRAQWWLAAFAFVEASFFPIPPHPLLGLMCLAEPRKAVRYAAIATVASVLGGLLGYAIGRFVYDTIGTELLALLGLTRSFPAAACYLREYGAEIIMIKGATPIPFKLLTITAGFIAMPLATFIAASAVSRAISFMIVGVLFRLFGAPIKAFIDRYLGLAVAAFAVLVVGGFLAFTLIGGDAHGSQDRCATAAAPA
jgi:membrane protein YqaA with SNARE-associated domain